MYIIFCVTLQRRKKSKRSVSLIDTNPQYKLINQQTLQIMNINKVKKYGEFVEITAPVERTTAEEYPTVLGGEIWYN